MENPPLRAAQAGLASRLCLRHLAGLGFPYAKLSFPPTHTLPPSQDEHSPQGEATTKRPARIVSWKTKEEAGLRGPGQVCGTLGLCEQACRGSGLGLPRSPPSLNWTQLVSGSEVRYPHKGACGQRPRANPTPWRGWASGSLTPTGLLACPQSPEQISGGRVKPAWPAPLFARDLHLLLN